jgi:hypothetical protein
MSLTAHERDDAITARREEFGAAQRKFVAAAAELLDAWENIPDHTGTYAIEDYPSYLPSFDSFVVDLEVWRDTQQGGI